MLTFTFQANSCYRHCGEGRNLHNRLTNENSTVHCSNQILNWEGNGLNRILVLKLPSVYIVTNVHHTTLYIGVTSDLGTRMFQHKNKLIKGFSAKYNLTKLVYFEQFEDMESAILREKRLKEWHRSWKNRLISDLNPSWRDLYSEII